MPFVLAQWVADLPVSPIFILMLIMAVYVVGGCIMDGLGFLVVSIPIFFPVALALGYDPIFFTVVIIIVTTTGAITPPVGVNIYVVSALVPDVPIQKIFKGANMFLVCYAVCVFILIVFPEIIFFLPRLIL